MLCPLLSPFFLGDFILGVISPLVAHAVSDSGSTLPSGLATARSNADCRFIQNSGVVPRAWESSQAVLELTPRFPLITWLMR